MMKSLFTMDAYIVIRGGTDAVRAVQQWMNHRYAGRTDYFVVPCDGIFSRDVQRGLMLGLQYEIGMADGVANGNFGPGTQSGIKNSGLVSPGSSDGSRAFVHLFQAGLIFNAFPTSFDGVFGAGTASVVRDFQSFAELPESVAGDYATWASLLVSTGDPSRSAAACDTSKPLTAATAALLKSAGYKTVGRYLSVAEKRYAPGELELIFEQGLSTFPIFQEWNNEASYFSQEKGFTQGVAAVKRARNLGFKSGTILYFAVDYDATDDEMECLMFPYFTGIKEAVESSRLIPYRVGVYGTRNLCSRVAAEGLSVASFVSGMSTGYSGNLGFRLPSNWAYAQVQEYSLGSGATALPVDKDVRSKRAEPVTSVLPTPVLGKSPDLSFDEDFLWRFGDLCYLAEANGDRLLGAQDYADIVLLPIQQQTYWDIIWRTYTALPELREPVANNPHRTALIESRARYEVAAKSVPSPTQTGYDVAHLAASIRAYFSWPLPSNAPLPFVGDLGGWALDLVTCWADYALARERGPVTGGAKKWLQDAIGGTAGTFDRADLVADMDAFLIAKRIGDDAKRPLSDIVREIAFEHDRDRTWRPRTFWAERFSSSRDRAVATVVILLAQAYWVRPQTSGPAWLKLQPTRFPGSPASGVNASDETELAGELGGVAEAFADKLISLTKEGL
jgi:peptidoglycan hydrolase-like protein with peptidoglycan-binding domain